MDWSSWLRRSVSSSKNSRNPDQQIPKPGGGREEEEQLGITQQLIDHVKSFTVDTFKNFPPQDEAASSSSSSSSTTTSSNVQRDLSEWQERQLVMFFPKTRYELHAIRLAKLKGMAIENEESSNTIGFEVEMAETKPPTS